MEGIGRQAGSVLFFPPNVSQSFGKKGQDYYDKIKDVIDRVLQRRNEVESKIADTFIAERGDPTKKVHSPAPRPRRSTQGSRRPPLPRRGLVDLSWKDGGSTYPKRSSRLGLEYQATKLPSVRSTFNASDEGSDL